jgi:hypothetical protein
MSRPVHPTFQGDKQNQLVNRSHCEVFKDAGKVGPRGGFVGSE